MSASQLCFIYSTSLTLFSPSYNCASWLGIKHQVTSLLFPVASFHSILVWCHSVLFCWGRCRIHSLVSFFSLGLFFGLLVFRGSILSNLQGCFDILRYFFQVCSKAFLSLMILLISAFLRANFFKQNLGAFSCVFFYRVYLHLGSILSSTPYIGLLCLLRMHAINSCDSDSDGMISPIMVNRS